MNRKTFLSFCATVTTVWMLATSADSRIMMQGFYWDVPSPSAGNPEAPWWWDHLAEQSQSFAASGITSIWIPPVTKANSGGFSVGYDPFDDYDLGAKNQKGAVPTRYGSREQLQRFAAVARANGIDLIADIVANHRNGDPGNFVFEYPDAFGNPTGGRFPKGPLDFHPNVPQCPNVPGDIASFGRDVAHVTGTNIGNGIIDATDWKTRALDLKGYRLDYVKGVSCTWLVRMLNSKAMKGKFAVAEYWDGDDKAVADYQESWMEGRVTAFDFPLRYLLRDMCNNKGSFDMRLLHRGGFMGRNAANAVTFVDNHDTAREDAVHDKAIAYAMILTSEGYPCIFYKDYAADKDCLGMKPVIDKLIKINKIAVGPTRERWKSDDVFCYERTGGKKLLVGLNDNPEQPQTITPMTLFGPNVRLTDYTGHAPDITTDANGQATITIPANKGGMGYVAYSVAGQNLSLPQQSFATTQDYEASADLDIKPAINGQTTDICRIYVEAGKPVTVSVIPTGSKWNPGGILTISGTDRSGSVVGKGVLKSIAPKSGLFRFVPAKSTSIDFKATLAGSKDSKAMQPFILRLNYTAPKTIAKK